MNNCRNAKLWREHVCDTEQLSLIAKQYDFHCHKTDSDM